MSYLPQNTLKKCPFYDIIYLLKRLDIIMSKKHYNTEREYLSSLTPPLAKAAGRGRFSKQALEALVKARENGVTFGSSKDDSLGNSLPPEAEASGGTSSADIRAWAIDNGYEVPARGRISEEIIAAYNGNPLTPSDEWLAKPVPVQTKVRNLTTMYGETVEGYKVGFSLCRRCTSHIMYCTCKAGPLPPSIVVKVLDQTHS